MTNNRTVSPMDQKVTRSRRCSAFTRSCASLSLYHVCDSVTDLRISWMETQDDSNWNEKDQHSYLRSTGTAWGGGTQGKVGLTYANIELESSKRCISVHDKKSPETSLYVLWNKTIGKDWELVWRIWTSLLYSKLLLFLNNNHGLLFKFQLVKDSLSNQIKVCLILKHRPLIHHSGLKGQHVQIWNFIHLLLAPVSM